MKLLTAALLLTMGLQIFAADTYHCTDFLVEGETNNGVDDKSELYLKSLKLEVSKVYKSEKEEAAAWDVFIADRNGILEFVVNSPFAKFDDTYSTLSFIAGARGAKEIKLQYPGVNVDCVLEQ